MKLESLRELFIEELQDLYSAERMILKALPKMVEKATNASLRDGFEQHRIQTEGHVRRLDQIFDLLKDTDIDREDKKCKGMEGILKENEDLLKEDAEPEVLDAGMIAGAQRVEHYEIAAYGTVRTLADQLGFDDAKDLLDQTLDEEGQADKLLTKIATGGLLKTGINEKAAR